MKIKYSFVIPVYGCEQYLEACVESILAQKGEHSFEIILVDDGSRDRSGQIADALALRDARIRTFHKENGGAASARNFGLQQVTGEYVLFVDSDDTVEDQLLDHVDEALSEDPDALVIFGMAFDFYHKRKLNRVECLSCKHKGYLSYNEIVDAYKDLFIDNSLSSVCNKVFSLKTIKRNTLTFDQNLMLYEDLVFTMAYLQHVECAVFLPVCFYHYRICLENNRYLSRTSSIKSVNYMLSTMRNSMCYINAKDSLEIRCGILQQIMLESLSECCFRIGEFRKKAVEFNKCAEFIYIYNETVQGQIEVPKVFALIDSRNYTRLWYRIVYKRMRRTLVHCLKCGEDYALLLRKYILEKK